MPDVVMFRFDSLPGVTFTATRSTEEVIDPRGMRLPVGWIDFVTTDDGSQEMLSRSGIAGPATVDDLSTRETLTIRRRWEVFFTFPSLPGVTFFAERSTRPGFGDQPRSRTNAGWVRLAMRRDADGDLIELGGFAGADPARLATADSTFVVTSITSDVDPPDAADLLGIDYDARALATLVAARNVAPPLAIGVYGEWGTGKTFFMKRIQRWVQELEDTTGREDRIFESGIAPVWFNAWHYAGGNILASLLSEIFGSLTPVATAPEADLEKALENLSGAQQVRIQADEQKAAAAAKVAEAERILAETKERHKEALSKLEELRGKDLLAALSVDEEFNRQRTEILDAAKELGVEEGIETVRDLSDAASKIISLTSRATFLANAGKSWWQSPLACALYVFLVVAVGGAALGWMLHESDVWVGTVTVATGQFVAIGGAAATWLKRQSGLLRKILAPAEEVQRRIEARLTEAGVQQAVELAALEEQVDAAVLALGAATEREADARAAERAAEDEKNSLNGQRLLRRYLEDRANSTDYDEYKGLFALAHRDLRELSNYLLNAAPATETSDVGSGSHHPQLRRIVLYIDDLDRCSPQIVCEVLAAVHLLLALPLFAVVVGVDPYWLELALKQNNFKSTSSEYLEKIFQLTYTLPPMSEESCITLLTESAHALKPHSTETLAEPSGIATTRQSEISAAARDEVLVTEQASVRAVQPLVLDDSEIDAFRTVSVLLARSPRQAKRFLSIYLVARARVAADPAIQHLNPYPLLVIAALLTGLPKATREVASNRFLTADSSLSLQEWLSQQPVDGMDQELEVRFQVLQRLSHELLIKPLLDSGGQGNTLRRGAEAKAFTWPVVESLGDGVQFSLAVAGEVRLLR